MNNKKCYICHTNKCAIKYKPCNHVIICYGCFRNYYNKIKICALCRKKIKKISTNTKSRSNQLLCCIK